MAAPTREQADAARVLEEALSGAVTACMNAIPLPSDARLFVSRWLSEAAAAGASPADNDPRWDVVNFNKYCDSCRLAWVRVGYLRELHEIGKPVPYQQLAAAGSLHIGAPPEDVQLYAIISRWLGENFDSKEKWMREPRDVETVHFDPDGFNLAKIVHYLNDDGAYDDDLVYLHSTSVKCFEATEHDSECARRYHEGSAFLNTHHRIKTILIAELPESFTKPGILDRAWGVHEFHLSAYCQRIVNSAAPLVKSALTPEHLRSANEKVKTAGVLTEYDRERILGIRRRLLGRMLPARDDAIGFRTVCAVSGLRWIRVSYIHELVKRGGPLPKPGRLTSTPPRPPGSRSCAGAAPATSAATPRPSTRVA